MSSVIGRHWSPQSGITDIYGSDPREEDYIVCTIRNYGKPNQPCTVTVGFWNIIDGNKDPIIFQIGGGGVASGCCIPKARGPFTIVWEGSPSGVIEMSNGITLGWNP